MINKQKMNFISTEKESETEFLSDSGASDHMVCSKINLMHLEEPVVICAAKSKMTLIAKVGDLKVSTNVNEKEISLIIKRVLFVPASSNNLLSIHRLEIIGFEVYLKMQKVLFRGRRSQLYCL